MHPSEAIEAAEFARDRLRTVLPRLQEAQAQEYLAQWRADFQGLKVERDVLAAALREVYPPHATKDRRLVHPHRGQR